MIVLITNIIYTLTVMATVIQITHQNVNILSQYRSTLNLWSKSTNINTFWVCYNSFFFKISYKSVTKSGTYQICHTKHSHKCSWKIERHGKIQRSRDMVKYRNLERYGQIQTSRKIWQIQKSRSKYRITIWIVKTKVGLIDWLIGI